MRIVLWQSSDRGTVNLVVSDDEIGGKQVLMPISRVDDAPCVAAALVTFARAIDPNGYANEVLAGWTMTGEPRELYPTSDILRPRTANDTQVAGAHYQQNTGLCPKCGAAIQHWDLYARMPYLEGVATKYLTRWRSKGGIEDLHKAIHYIQKLIEVEALAAKQTAPK